jgi:hypothetical protein
MTEPDRDDHELQQLLRRIPPTASLNVDGAWDRLQSRRRVRRQTRVRIGSALAMAAGFALIVAWPRPRPAGPDVDTRGPVATANMEDLERLLRSRVQQMNAAGASALLEHLDGIDAAIDEVTAFRPTSAEQEATRGEQLERLIQRRLRLLRNAAEQLAADVS